MSKVAIVTDSTAYIPNKMLKQYNITVVPLILIWGEETYRDGVDMMPGEFYKRLATSKVMPTTSQATIPSMQDAFEGLIEQGYDVLGIFISSKLSGTVQSAIQAREMVRKGKDKLELQEGRIESVEKIRTKGKALDRMLDMAEERMAGRTPVRLATVHANAEAEALTLLETAKNRFNPVESLHSVLSPVIGAHAGPGTVALAFMTGL